MSFAHKVKEELIEYDKAAREAGNETPESLHAERYGLFLFCRNFSMQNMCLKANLSNSLLRRQRQETDNQRPMYLLHCYIHILFQM